MVNGDTNMRMRMKWTLLVWGVFAFACGPGLRLGACGNHNNTRRLLNEELK